MNKRFTPFAYALALLPAACPAQTLPPQAGTLGPRPAPPAPKPAGDQRAIAQREYHRRLRDGLRAFAFYDHGWIELHRNPWAGFSGHTTWEKHGWTRLRLRK